MSELDDGYLNGFRVVPGDETHNTCAYCEHQFNDAELHRIYKPEHVFKYPGDKKTAPYTYTRPAEDIELCDDCYDQYMADVLDDMTGAVLLDYLQTHKDEPMSVMISALEKGGLK